MATPITFRFLVDVAVQQLLPPWGWSPSDRYSRPKGEAICHHHTHSSSCGYALTFSHLISLSLHSTLISHTSQSHSTLISHTLYLTPHSLTPFSHLTVLLHPHISHLTVSLHLHTSQFYSTLTPHSLTPPSDLTVLLQPHTSQSHSTLTPHSFTPPSHLTVSLHPHTSQFYSNLTHSPSPTWSCTSPKISFCCPVSVFRLCFHVP